MPLPPKAKEERRAYERPTLVRSSVQNYMERRLATNAKQRLAAKCERLANDQDETRQPPRTLADPAACPCVNRLAALARLACRALDFFLHEPLDERRQICIKPLLEHRPDHLAHDVFERHRGVAGDPGALG